MISCRVFLSTIDSPCFRCRLKPWRYVTCLTVFLGRWRRPYIVFRFRFLYGFMFVYIYTYIYICHKMAALGFPWIYQAFTHFVFICAAIWSNEKYSRTLPYNTKPSPSLRRTFSRRKGRKKKGSCNKLAAPEASVHPVRNRLCYHFFLYLTNESCSRIVSRRLMLLRSLNKSYLRVKCYRGWTAILLTFSHCSARNTKTR